MLNIGKLDSDLLEKIVFDKIKYKSPLVLARPGIGEDCAVVDFGDYDCVMSSDPITAAISDIGSLAVNISCNDVASNGVVPIAMLITALFPYGTTEEDVETVMDQAGQAASDLEVEIAGGHTEITNAVKQPVIVSTVIGRQPKGGAIDTSKIAPGDSIIMTKMAGIEGTGVIASDKEDEIKDLCQGDEMKFAKSLLYYVSVVKEGIIGGYAGVHGMHDITEGGVLGAVWEMCKVGGVGAKIDTGSVPVLAITARLCAKYDIDPLRLISSGSMLMIVPEEKVERLIESLDMECIKATCIGKIVPAEEGIKDQNGNDIDPPSEDEIYKAV